MFITIINNNQGSAAGSWACERAGGGDSTVVGIVVRRSFDHHPAPERPKRIRQIAVVALRAALGFGRGSSSVSNQCRVSTKSHGDVKPLKAVNSRASAVVVSSQTRPGRTWHLVRLSWAHSVAQDGRGSRCFLAKASSVCCVLPVAGGGRVLMFDRTGSNPSSVCSRSPELRTRWR